MDHLIAIKKLRTRIFIRGALVTVGTFVLNTLGVWLSLYSIIWWYDMPMHFFGGLFTALLVIWFLIHYKKFVNLSLIKTCIIVLLITLIIGVVWEGYEFIFAIIGSQKYIILDSTSDLCFDLAGAIQALFIYFRHKRALSV